MLNNWQKKFSNFLIEKKLLRENQLKDVEILLLSEGKGFMETLTKGGFVDNEKLAEKAGDFFGFPYVNLLEQEISQEIFNFLPEKIIADHSCVCFFKKENLVHIALAEPDNLATREVLDFWASSKNLIIKYFVASSYSLAEVKRRFSGFSNEVASVVSQASKERESLEKESIENVENFSEVVKKAPVSEIVTMIIKNAVVNKASDIHIEPYEGYSRVRFRVDGILNTVLNLPVHIHDSIISRIKVLSGLKIDETRVPQDGRFKFKAPGVDYDLRVSTMPLFGKEKATLRILDISGKALTLEQLGFNEKLRTVIDQALRQTYGMILVTGPTGSGKSTTLFSMLSMLNKEGINITTLEDPIEYNIPGINQAQIRPEVKFSFASGLRSLLRQDPDIIMVGEIRDGETAEMAVHAALTGHLLFSTLHTNDSLGAIPRLVDMKVEPFLLASTLNLVIAQRLARRLCPRCKEEVLLSLETSNKIKKELVAVNEEYKGLIKEEQGRIKAYKAVGCSFCKETGYSGRVVVAEVLPISGKLKEIISSDFNREEMEKEVLAMGIPSLLQDGLQKVLLGVTTIEEVFRVANEIEEQS